MKILFVHQNFPGQFPHLAPALAARGHEVLALTDEKNARPSPVKVARYKSPKPMNLGNIVGRVYPEYAQRGFLAARGARALRDRHGYTPDVIVGHSGWGETLFLREIWPDARLIVYAELMYRTRGQDVGFDPEFSADTDDSRFLTIARSAHLLQGIVQADAGLAPTRYQADSFPPELRSKITVIHDGIDTDRLRPDPQARLTLPDGRALTAADEVITYVSRSLEPYRGFHIFMRALPEVLAARPKAQIVVIGATEGASYGGTPADAASWKDKFLAELGDGIDAARVHFLGRVPYEDYIAALQIGRAHCYLTFPFVLSWSLTEAMSAGAMVLASDTDPVRELIRDGENGRLLGFHDVAGWSQAMIRALAGDDPDAARLRQAARRTIVEGYDLKTLCLPRLIRFVESGGRES